MTQVWGVTYDGEDSAWWKRQYDRIAEDCFGLTGGARNARTRPTVEERRDIQRFSRYRGLLTEALGGGAGRYSPEAVNRYVNGSRTTLTWVTQAKRTADAVSSTMAGFQELSDLRSQVGPNVPRTSPLQQEVLAYIDRRQAEVAPAVANQWLLDSAARPRTLAAAKALAREYGAINRLIAALDDVTKSAWKQKYEGLMWHLIEPDAQRLAATNAQAPMLLQGLEALSVATDRFEAEMGELLALPRVKAEQQRYTDARYAVLAGMSRAWTQEIEALGLNAPAVAGKRAELERLFAGAARRDGQFFERFEAPIKASEETIERTLGIPPSLTPFSLKVAGLDLDNGEDARFIYRGDFARVRLKPASVRLEMFLTNYLFELGTRCPALVPQASRVEMRLLQCTGTTNVYNGFGTLVSSGCSNWTWAPTGVFADERLYGELEQVRSAIASDIRRFVNPRSWGETFGATASAEKSIKQLFDNNKCSNAIGRLSDNLLRWLQNDAPVRLP